MTLDCYLTTACLGLDCPGLLFLHTLLGSWLFHCPIPLSGAELCYYTCTMLKLAQNMNTRVPYTDLQVEHQ